MKNKLKYLMLCAMLVSTILLLASQTPAQSSGSGDPAGGMAQTVRNIFDWPQGRLNPTVSGRVFASSDPNGMAVAGAIVYVTDENGNIRSTHTNSFGYYRFFTVTGTGCVVSVEHKRYRYEPQYTSLDGDVVDFNFFPMP